MWLRGTLMTKETINFSCPLCELTGNYKEWVIASLKDEGEAVLFLHNALQEYKKDKDFEALKLAIRYAAEAHTDD